MNLPRLWTTSQELTPDPFRAMRREMENALAIQLHQSPISTASSSPELGRWSARLWGSRLLLDVSSADGKTVSVGGLLSF